MSELLAPFRPASGRIVAAFMSWQTLSTDDEMSWSALMAARSWTPHLDISLALIIVRHFEVL